MITPGKIRYRLRHGLIAAYYRDTVRKRILDCPPIEGMDDDACEVHVLTSSDDFLNAIWSIRSFYVYTASDYRLCIHLDPTVEEPQLHHLKCQFPDARIVTDQEGRRAVREHLDAYPAILKFRDGNRLSAKVLDSFLCLHGKKLIVLDSDVLFFAHPTAFLERCGSANRKASFNRDVATAYVLDAPTAREKVGVTLSERLNSGLGVIPADYFDPELLEKALGAIAPNAHFWRIEQTLFAVMCSALGSDPLPGEYDVYTSPQPLADRPSRHYVGAVRHLMYSEGMRRLVRSGFLRKGV